MSGSSDIIPMSRNTALYIKVKINQDWPKELMPCIKRSPITDPDLNDGWHLPKFDSSMIKSISVVGLDKAWVFADIL